MHLPADKVNEFLPVKILDLGEVMSVSVSCTCCIRELKKTVTGKPRLGKLQLEFKPAIRLKISIIIMNI